MIIETKEEMIVLGEKIGRGILGELRGRCVANEEEATRKSDASGAIVRGDGGGASEARARGEGGVVIELVGDVGAGKTTLTQGIARGLGVRETITSPSFTLSKRYGFRVGGEESAAERSATEGENVEKSAAERNAAEGESAEKGGDGVLVHYDFYRLADPGIMEEDLAEAMRGRNSVVIIEWGESVQEILPRERKTIMVKYREDGGREVEIEN